MRRVPAESKLKHYYNFDALVEAYTSLHITHLFMLMMGDKNKNIVHIIIRRIKKKVQGQSEVNALSFNIINILLL